MNQENPPVITLCISAKLEALLFVAPGPVTISQLATSLGLSNYEVEQGLATLSAIYQDNDQERGLRIQRNRGRLQLTTAPQMAETIERFLDLDTSTKLSRAGLEALAIIAYLQPVTRPQVDAIRGVSSDGVLKSLLSKGLIMDVGRAEAVGRPILYCTTADFLQYFGLSNLDELPPFEQKEILEDPG